MGQLAALSCSARFTLSVGHCKATCCVCWEMRCAAAIWLQLNSSQCWSSSVSFVSVCHFRRPPLKTLFCHQCCPTSVFTKSENTKLIRMVCYSVITASPKPLKSNLYMKTFMLWLAGSLAFGRVVFFWLYWLSDENVHYKVGPKFSNVRIYFMVNWLSLIVGHKAFGNVTFGSGKLEISTFSLCFLMLYRPNY